MTVPLTPPTPAVTLQIIQIFRVDAFGAPSRQRQSPVTTLALMAS